MYHIFGFFFRMTVQGSNLNESHMLHTSFFLTTENEKNSRVHTSYPYNSIELSAVFVHGHDLDRHVEVDIFLIPKNVMILFGITTFLFLTVTIVLWIGRMKLIKQNDFLLAALDISILIFGGGNLRIQHRFEKWFFGILMLLVIFALPVYTSVYLDEAYYMLNQRLSTFEELGQFNLSVYSSSPLRNHNNDIQEMLRYVLIKNKM